MSAAGLLEAFQKGGLGINARAVVGDHDVGVLQPVLLRRPGGERLVELRNRERDARHVRRLGGDDGGCRVHHHHELLGLGGNVGAGHRVGCQLKASQDIDVVARHQFLRQPFGDRRVDAADILADDFDSFAGKFVAVLLEIEFDAIVTLCRRVGKLARVRHDNADLDSILRMKAASQKAWHQKAWHENKHAAEQKALHRILPFCFVDAENASLCQQRKAPRTQPFAARTIFLSRWPTARTRRAVCCYCRITSSSCAPSPDP